MAVLVNQVAAKTKASNTVARRAWAGAGAGAGTAEPATGPAGAASALRGVHALSGSPTTRCSAAQAQQAPRHPQCNSIHIDSGHPTVLAKPAIKVIPVMELRAFLPCKCTNAANAAS